MAAMYVKNIPAKFHPDPIWNERALGFLEQVAQPEEQDE